LTQGFTVTVGAVHNASTASGCTGNGSSASPWVDACINGAVTAASSGDTVFLPAGNWALPTGISSNTGVTIAKAGINLVGAGSSNTFNAYGNPNYTCTGAGNCTSIGLCPNSGPSSGFTCVMTSLSAGGSENTGFGGFVKFTNCNNATVSHIYCNGSLHTSGGDHQGTITFNDSCATTGPVIISDIRFLGFGNPSVSGEGQFSSYTNSGLTLQNSVLGLPASGISNGLYPNEQVYEPVFDKKETIKNNVFYQGWYNPTDDDSTIFTGNVQWVGVDALAGSGNRNQLGMDGCNPNTCAGGSTIGNYHFTASNNYFKASGLSFGTGGGINDPGGGGGVSDLNWTGNWIVADQGEIAGCSIKFTDTDGQTCHSGVAGPNLDGMQINGTGGPGGNCLIATSGTCFNITNNSIIATTTSQLDATGTGCVPYPADSACPGGGTDHNNTVVNFNAHQNYISSPSNQYQHDTNTINPSVTGNYCDNVTHTGITTFTQTDSTQCATTGFTTVPTVTFTLGNLYQTVGGDYVVPFTGTNFTAQYGAVIWLASTSPTAPTSSGQTGTGCNASACVWSYVPPVYLAGATHASTVYLWTMDSINHVSTASSAVVP